MPNRFKSEMPEAKPLYEKDKTAGELIDAILAKYPQHKEFYSCNPNTTITSRFPL
jgi:hypothetical protein